MKFLEAKRVLSAFEGGDALPFLLAMSGQPEPLEIFLRAAAAERGFELVARTLPFNTLTQALHAPPIVGETEVFLLFPWDLLPAADWRSGTPDSVQNHEDLVTSARDTGRLFQARPNARLIYVEAPLPPLSLNNDLSRALGDELRAIAVSVGARVLGSEVVSLESYLAHGTALASAQLGTVARLVVERAAELPRASGKVVVTDFDNTLWHGVVGEDGVEGLELGPRGTGFPHFIYQSYLKTLKGNGVLLAGVTKNDPDLAIAPLTDPESLLTPDDFIAIIASYHPKSAQLAELAQQLNLGLDSFVFVDDNPVEIAEVAEALPQVHTLQFPKGADALPVLMDSLSRFFHRDEVTTEDLDRTRMYRRMLEGMAPKDVGGADLSVFLAGLEMRLQIHDRSEGDRTRAVQLINKTNQFNLNGIRRPPEEVDEILADGGRLYTASLADRHGAHGEILSCLIDSGGSVRSLVMSCRVFQRRVEHAFLVWLSSIHSGTLPLEFVATERNAPVRQFLRDAAFTETEGAWSVDLPAFADTYGAAHDLFDLSAEELT